MIQVLEPFEEGYSYTTSVDVHILKGDTGMGLAKKMAINNEIFAKIHTSSAKPPNQFSALAV